MTAAKLFLGIVLVSILPACGDSARSKPVVPVDKQIQGLKDYAFCSCLGSCSAAIDSLLVKDGSATGYFEKSKYGENVFKQVDSLAHKGAAAIYKSKYGRPLCAMKCLDFYNSSSLDSLLQKISREEKLESK